MADTSAYQPTQRPSHTSRYTSARGTRKAAVSRTPKLSPTHSPTVAAVRAKWASVRPTRAEPSPAKGRVATPTSAPNRA